MHELLAILFSVTALHYFYFLLKIYKGLNNLYTQTGNKNTDEFISIIIPFRNESENILMSLHSIQSLNYPKEKFEVIYVDDDSEDDSYSKLCSAVTSPNIKVLQIVETAGKAHKKRAVALGIEKSKGEIIVTTDADCLHSAEWLNHLCSMFDENTGMAAGPVDYHPSTKFVNKLQRLELQGLILAGAGLIGIGNPVICSAANLAYRKKVFYEVGGFSGLMNLSSGDDELLMQKIYKTGKYKIKFCAEPQAVVYTESNNSITQFFNQRTRWASKGLFYDDKKLIFQLVLIFLFYLSLPVMIILSFINSIFIFLLFAAVSGKYLMEYLILKKGDTLIFKSNLLKYLFAAEIFQIPYIIITGITGSLGLFSWKGRKLKR